MISSIKSRLQQILWEVDQFMRYGSASGHSVTQRLEFWRAATRIVSENILMGVGTGDMPTAYEREYRLMNSRLDKAHRLRAHNQFLAIFVAFGFFGFVYFLIVLFYPVFSSRIKTEMLFSAFFLISFLSMLSEDTLETQAGVTFFSFFFVLFLSAKDSNKEINY
jgi:O-antigen ligase